ncbi:carbohydrate kinase family protein [Spirosoma sordidisoli]|uniref:Carbohydrate kinase n=1 Tax=Spirosoma sordidisoli TaxID=2502893 RepID=A0A4Q2UI18_9BACT|nr:carbohydrate kinase [Spirosoma sordidisoli]RYC67121.1 carbohydrate kinase [Spirosoma sordidisoli]
MTPTILCFGETLWDVLPTGKQAGGAPMNVAVHCRHIGLDARLISRLGSDALGNELLDFLQEKGVDLSLIQRGKTHLTGVVKADVSNRNEVTYQIVQPVAWDYIQYDDELARLVAASDAFVFGSLAARLPVSRETLYRLLDHARLAVFDVNLRAPHYTAETVGYLLERTHIAKMNHHELADLAGWFTPGLTDEAAMRALTDQFGLSILCVTRGENGAALLVNGQFYEHNGYPVEVVDTIGSGDAFLASLLRAYLAQTAPETWLPVACAAGSLVATCRGATPDLSLAALHQFMHQTTTV